MSGRQLRAIAIGVAVLLLLWGGSELLSRRPERAAPELRLPPLTEKDVDSVAIVHGKDTIVLARQSPGAWTVNGFAAAPAAMSGLFTALRDSAPHELAAESPSSFARMGVDSAGGRWVRVRGRGATLATVIVGGHGPDYDAFYLRVPGDSRVYLWRGALATLVGRSVDDWRDHTIAAVPPESIAAVEVRRAASGFVLERQGGKWRLASGAPVDSAAAARFVASFRNVAATGFATERQADSIGRARAHPRRSVVVRGSGRKELLALAFDSSAAGFWVRHGATVYRLDAWQVNQLTPTPDTFKR